MSSRDLHVLLTPDCPPIVFDLGVEILATGVLEYTSLERGPEIAIDDSTQIVFTRDLVPAPPTPYRKGEKSFGHRWEGEEEAPGAAASRQVTAPRVASNERCDGERRSWRSRRDSNPCPRDESPVS